MTEAANIHRDAVLEAIRVERVRQTAVEGWTVDHDDAHSNGDIAKAAAAYAWLAGCEDYEKSKDPANIPHLKQRKNPLYIWPWDMMWWEPKDRRRDLIRAAALIVAEIERLDRAKYRMTFR